MATKTSSTTKQKLSLPHILLLVAGLLFILKFLLDGGMPSPSSDLITFIAGLFTLIVIIGFYCCFLFFVKGCSSTTRALAPSILVLALYGQYAMNFGNPDVSRYVAGIASMIFTLIIVSGFVYLFFHNKVLGYVFSFGSLIYALFVLVSYFVVMIMGLVDGGSFDTMQFFVAMFLSGGLVCAGTSVLLISRRSAW